MLLTILFLISSAFNIESVHDTKFISAVIDTNDVYKALALKKEKKYEEARIILEQLVDQNDPEAMYYLADLYDSETGYEDIYDIKKSISLLKRSGDLGYSRSYSRLGYIYSQDIHIKPNYNKALSYFLVAANDGYMHAAIEASNIYLSGKTGTPDTTSAMNVLMNPLYNNEQEIQYTIGNILASNDKNREASIVWFKRSAYNGNIASHVYLSKYYNNAYIASYWYNRLARIILSSEEDLTYYTTEVGHSYYTLSYVLLDEEEYEKYIKDLKVRVKENDTEAAMILGKAYESGSIGLIMNVERAMDLYNIAAQFGNIDAIERLAIDFYNRKDYKLAVEYFEKGASMGSKRSNFYLGYMYYNGIHLPVDIKKSHYHYSNSYTIDDFN